MQKSILKLVFCLLLIQPLTGLNAQTLYFQRQVSIPSNNGYFSSIPVTGPASSLSNILSSITNTASAGVVFEGSGNFYISDVNSNLITKVNKNGTSEVAVSPDAAVSSPRGLALDTANKLLFIMDRSNLQIFRANLNITLPATTVDIITSDSQYTGNMNDIHYNAADNKLYWSNSGALFRASVGMSESLPVTPEQINVTTATTIKSFVFDSETPQNIYFVDSSVSQGGIFKSSVPGNGVTNLSETRVFDPTSNPALFITGLAIDKNSNNSLCYSGGESAEIFVRCGNRSNISGFTEILRDTGDFTTFTEAPVFMDMEPSDIIPTPTPSPTLTPSPTSTPQVVTPDIIPDIPQVTVNTDVPKPRALVVLEKFSGADTKKSSQTAMMRVLNEFQQKAKQSKIGFRYAVEVKRTTDAAGTPIKGSKNKDIRNLTSKRNELTIKNLKTNSNYSVKYRVEITSKAPGQDLKVVKKTPFSPTANFVLQ